MLARGVWDMGKRTITLLALLLLPGFCRATEVEVSVPLQDGKLGIVQLRETLESALHLSNSALDAVPDVDVAVDLRGVNGWLFVKAVNGALGQGCQLTVDEDALRIRLDTSKLPGDWDQTCDALNCFTRIEAPEATARQARRFGLHLPMTVDSKRPMVVLIHGLDGDGSSCADLANLLHGDGYQTATFAYPTERPLAENVAVFTQHMSALREEYPDLKIDLVTESMGGLIARRYVEGPQYLGGVDRLILIAPPNEGSSWVGAGWILKVIVNAASWKCDPEWSPAWMITEGICQEAKDLRPRSDFLRNLNAEPRRAEVRYTIIAGDRPAGYRYEANVLAVCAAAMDGQFSHWLGLDQVERAIESEREQLLSRRGESDGPVSLTSAALPGVSDFVAVPADHVALFKSVDGEPPAAWPIIHERLAN
jgi:pimeloyl-ACP methyl ester carboxylesterase